VNNQLLNRVGMKKMRRSGKSGGQENSRWLHRHAPLTSVHAQ